MSSKLAKCVTYVLDAAALFASYQLMLPHDVRVVTTPLIIEEVKDEASKESIGLSLSAGKLSIVDVDDDLMREAVRVAEELGEVGKLSRADLSLIALMIKYLREGCSVILVTDDYSIQNVATYLNIYVLGVKRRVIEKVIKYVWVCESCGYRGEFDEFCPVCGGRMVRRPSRVKGVDGPTQRA
ncbi:MAG: NOB1 family endonuclease [Sulfolobales archaeon]